MSGRSVLIHAAAFELLKGFFDNGDLQSQREIAHSTLIMIRINPKLRELAVIPEFESFIAKLEALISR